MGGGLEKRPGGSSLVQQTLEGGRAGTDTPGKRTLTEQLTGGEVSGAAIPPPGQTAGSVATVGIAPTKPPLAATPGAKQPGANAKTGAKPHGGLGDWIGAGQPGKIFRNTTSETFVDPATKDSSEVETSWTMAEYEQFEIETNMVMEVDRKIHIQLGRGAGVVIKSRARVFFNADQLPNDVHAALYAPARLLKHDGSIFVTDDKGIHLLKTFDLVGDGSQGAHCRSAQGPRQASRAAQKPA